MLLSPKKYKFSKSFSSIYKKNTNNKLNLKVNYGSISLVASKATRLTNFQIEALRIFIRRHLKKNSQIFFRVFPNVPITKKPNEIRLGCGKGPLKFWVFNLNKGDTILELASTSTKKSIYYLKAARYKIATKSIIFNKYLRWIF